MNIAAGHYGPRILDGLTAARLPRLEWRAADLHLHTSCSYDVLSAPSLHPVALYEKAMARGMDYITFTDHDTMDAYDILGWTRPRLVTGVEISILDLDRVGHTVHVNVYQLSKSQYTELASIARAGNIYTFLDAVRNWDLPHHYNHPFWFEPGDKPNWSVIPELVKEFPVIEYNMHRVKRKNRLAVALAEQHGKGVVATTDSHLGDVGAAYTVAKGGTFREFWNEIRDGNTFLVPADLTIGALQHEAKGWIDLVFDREIATASRKKDFTEVKFINWLINSPTASLRPAKIAIKAMIKAASYSGIPMGIYIGKQHMKARQIGKQLGLAVAG